MKQKREFKIQQPWSLKWRRMTLRSWTARHDATLLHDLVTMTRGLANPRSGGEAESTFTTPTLPRLLKQGTGGGDVKIMECNRARSSLMQLDQLKECDVSVNHLQKWTLREEVKGDSCPACIVRVAMATSAMTSDSTVEHPVDSSWCPRNAHEIETRECCTPSPKSKKAVAKNGL